MKSGFMVALFLTAATLGVQAFASELNHQRFEQQIRSSVAPLAGKEIAALKVVYLNADVGPWMDTGLGLKPGDRITLVLDGKVWLSRTYNLSFEPSLAVWARIGERGPIFRGSETNTVTIKESGTLQLKTYPGERWLDDSGRYAGEPAAVNPDGGGGASVAILLWNRGADIQEQLKRMAAADTTAQWAASELGRQTSPEKKLPAGWYYLWELGPSQMFGEVTGPAGEGAPKRAIDLHTKNDAAILKTDVSVALTPTTTLSWKWKADKLPASLPENTLPTHDYMSIAVEFDNGQDITFMWSHDLAVGQVFRCPLPGWDFRETHIVAQSGTGALGKWIDEQYNVFDSYKKAVTGPMPRRITKIWLIGVGLFQHVEGMSQFGEIVLRDGTKEIRVFADSEQRKQLAINTDLISAPR